MTAGNQEFKDKTALITGGARNIGLAIAKDLASKGAAVAIVDICRDLETIPYSLSTTDDLDKSIAELTALGVKAIGETCDVRDENQVRSAVAGVIKAFGHLDILVNNAGVISLFPINELSASAWNEVLDVCLKGTFFCCKHVVPQMVKQRYGKIVNISSVAGLRGLGLSVHYAAAKHGVIGLTKALAMEVADHNINVNAVCPGTVESPMLDGLAFQVDLDGDPYEHFSQGHLFRGRHITPLDIANAVRWLVSDQSRFLTGTVISIDAGWSARG
ncbi:Oxidoreductase, short-chain dehydrogenase/reductase family [Olavius sp. associated proteobacterium Delta 1]|nr:Oxidoreductase, short-chain dehydrogenase/reductase family [Olavius sp. associated proteobacterium Delta 1]